MKTLMMEALGRLSTVSEAQSILSFLPEDLTISSHQGIHSLGLLATVGSLSILAAAVLFLPAVLQVLKRQ